MNKKTEPAPASGRMFVFEELEGPDGGPGRTIGFTDVDIRPRSYAELTAASPNQPVTIRLEMYNGRILHTDIDGVDPGKVAHVTAVTTTISNLLHVTSHHPLLCWPASPIERLITHRAHRKTPGKPAVVNQPTHKQRPYSVGPIRLFLYKQAGARPLFNPGSVASGTAKAIGGSAMAKLDLELSAFTLLGVTPRSRKEDIADAYEDCAGDGAVDEGTPRQDHSP